MEDQNSESTEQPEQSESAEGLNKEFSNPELGTIASTELPDMEQFEGARVKIEGWDTDQVNSYFDPNTGDRLQEPMLVDVVKVFTEPVGEGKKSDGSTFKIRGSAMFNLKKDKDGNLGISSHPTSNIQKFFKKIKVNTLKDMVGRYVTLTCDNNWLRIVYK